MKKPSITPQRMAVMEFTNLAYLFLALYMASRRDAGAALVLMVFIVSSVHHFFAYNRSWFWFDIFVACSVCLILAYMYLPLSIFDTNFMFVCSIVLFALALILFFSSGVEYTGRKFEMYHGLWHVLTAASFFLLLKSGER